MRPVPPVMTLVPPVTGSVPPVTTPVPLVTGPVPPVTTPVPPATAPVPPVTGPVPLVTGPVPPVTRPVPPVSRPVQPVWRVVQQVRRPVQPAMAVGRRRRGRGTARDQARRGVWENADSSCLWERGEALAGDLIGRPSSQRTRRPHQQQWSRLYQTAASGASGRGDGPRSLPEVDLRRLSSASSQASLSPLACVARRGLRRNAANCQLAMPVHLACSRPLSYNPTQYASKGGVFMTQFLRWARCVA
jgi:hypothetical protein